MNATQLTHFYSFAGDGCGHTVLGPESGTLASINYPQTSPNSTVCEWEIRVKPGQRIQLKFGDLDIDDSDSCHSSYLRVHNGIGPTRTEIGKLFSVLESCEWNRTIPATNWDSPTAAVQLCTFTKELPSM